jgi:hypothetical protein
MQLILALTGDLAKTLEMQEIRLKRALYSALEQTGMDVRDIWRAEMERQGIGKRLRNTIKFQAYPKKKDISFRPSVTVFSLAPKIMRGMTEAITIQSPGGGWLAIPTDNAPVRLMGKRPTPELYEQVYGAGRLRFFETKLGRSGVLIDDDVRTRSGQTKSGRSRSRFVVRSARSRAKASSAVMFTLVREVKTNPKFSLPDYEARGVAILAAHLRDELARLPLDYSDGAGLDGFDDDNTQPARQRHSQSARRRYDAARSQRRGSSR